MAGKPQQSQKGVVAVTSEAPEKWFVMLKDDASAGRVIAPLRPFLKFSRRMDKQIARLERRIRAEIPQLARRGRLSERAQRS